MKVLNVHEAKTRLSAVLANVEEKGEEYLICRNGHPAGYFAYPSPAVVSSAHDSEGDKEEGTH